MAPRTNPFSATGPGRDPLMRYSGRTNPRSEGTALASPRLAAKTTA